MKIFNLSSHILSENEISVLSRGLSFCPTNKIDEYQLFVDLHKYIRKLTLSRHFNLHKTDTEEPIVDNTLASTSDTTGIASSSPPPIHTELKPVSKFYPTHSKGNFIETFSSLVSDGIRTINQGLPSKHNLSLNEKKALKTLSSNTEIIIKSADKGGGTVILDKNDYLKEAERLLSDTKYYINIDTDPSASYHTDYLGHINEAFHNHILNKKEHKFLTITEPITPIFYYLPKIHKSLINPPGRPIIAGIGSLTSNLSQYVDRHLQKHVTSLDSHLKDTTSLLQDLCDFEWHEDYLFATLDVTSLYTNIPHNKGIESVGKFLDKDTDMPMKQRIFILESINFILKHNLFDFNGKLFLQKTGTAMGSRFAPSFANLYMGDFESEFIYQNLKWKDQIIYYKRYIDDLVFVWKGNNITFNDFTASLNNNNWGLTFSGECNNNTLNYLDITLYIDNNKVCTKNYFKQVDCNSFLDYKSQHHRKWLNNIPFGQFRRIRRNCTKNGDYVAQGGILRKRLKEKNYPTKIIDEAYTRASKLTQRYCITPKTTSQEPKPTKGDYKHSFITTYNHNQRHIRSILEKHWHILKSDPYLCDLIPDKPLMIFRRAQTIKNILAPSNIKKSVKKPPATGTITPKKPGSYKCHKKKCLCCKSIMNKTSSFRNNKTGEEFNIKQTLSCESSHIIYLLECTCNLQYIGRTKQTLRTRLNNHRFNITHGYEKHSVSRHAAAAHNCKMEEFRITPIEQISELTTDRTRKLNSREMYWIFKLNTLVPLGLNESLENIF